MGICLEFGPQINEGCDHEMIAHKDCCECPDCGARCTGLFRGCEEVWRRGRSVSLASRQRNGNGSVSVARSGPESSRADATSQLLVLEEIPHRHQATHRVESSSTRADDNAAGAKWDDATRVMVIGALRSVLTELSALNAEIRAQRADVREMLLELRKALDE